jgi:hypothetical protein
MFLLMLLNTFFAPIDIFILNSIMLIPVQIVRPIIAVATKANIALLTTATHHTIHYRASTMCLNRLLTLLTLHRI